MEKQTIDLLPLMYRKISIPFSFQKIMLIQLISIGIAGVLVLALFYWSLVVDNRLKKNEDAYKLTTQALTEFKNNNIKPSVDQKLKIRVSRYEKVLDRRQEFFEKMNSESFGFTSGFSEYLQAFSRQDFPEIWLNEISLLANGEGVGLKGYAVDAHNVPEFIRLLQNEPIFNGVLFDDLVLNREQKSEGDFITFTLKHGEISGFGGKGGNDFARILGNAGINRRGP